MPESLLVATDLRDQNTYPLSFDAVHQQGIPHRAVHIEIIDMDNRYFVWHRFDGRLEILGGHVDWDGGNDKPESYEEAALRELDEELQLQLNWNLTTEMINQRLQQKIAPTEHIVNQLPSTHRNNNEWVTVFRLNWQEEWSDPCNPSWQLSNEGISPKWMSIDEIEQYCIEKPMDINAALRLLLRRHNILVPLIMHELK